MMDGSSFSIKFLLKCHLDKVMFNPSRTVPLTFQCDEPQIAISIYSAAPKGTIRYGFDDLVCDLTCELPADRDLLSFVQGLERRVYLSIPGTPITVPIERNGETYIDAEGNIRADVEIFMDHCPPSLDKVCRLAQETLTSQHNRFLRLLRWRQDIDAPHFSVGTDAVLYFRVAEPQYIMAPRWRDAGQFVQSPRGIRWSTKHENSLKELWLNENVVEPVAHELLREAVYLHGTAPRSCLAMAATALEIGVKDHISRAKPDTAWLLSKMPSPPVYRILRDFLPSIYQGSSAIADWSRLKPLWNTCQKIAEDRNALVHAGANPSPGTLSGYLSATNDVLYLLDVLDGHEWARDCVSEEIRISQGWPEPVDGRKLVGISALLSLLDDWHTPWK